MLEAQLVPLASDVFFSSFSLWQGYKQGLAGWAEFSCSALATSSATLWATIADAQSASALWEHGMAYGGRSFVPRAAYLLPELEEDAYCTEYQGTRRKEEPKLTTANASGWVSV